MYKIIILSSSILILSPIFIILLKKCYKRNNLNYVPPPLKKSPSPRIRREHIHLEIPDNLQLDDYKLTPIVEEP